MDRVQETEDLVFHYYLKKKIILGLHAQEFISFPNVSQVPVLKPRPRNHQSGEQDPNVHGSAVSGRVGALHGTENCCLCISRPPKETGRHGCLRGHGDLSNTSQPDSADLSGELLAVRNKATLAPGEWLIGTASVTDSKGSVGGS